MKVKILTKFAMKVYIFDKIRRKFYFFAQNFQIILILKFVIGNVELVRWVEDMGSPSSASLYFQTAHDRESIGYITKEGWKSM